MIKFDPTNARKEHVDEVMNEWQTMKQYILVAHENRSTDTRDYMLRSLALYEKFLSQASDTDGFDADKLTEYEILPLNGEERYLFIKRKPEQYAAFCQLVELFEETKKKIARLRINSK